MSQIGSGYTLGVGGFCCSTRVIQNHKHIIMTLFYMLYISNNELFNLFNHRIGREATAAFLGRGHSQVANHTVVTLWLHCCYTIVTLSSDCCYTAVTLSLHCCYTVGTLLLHCCYTVAGLLLHCCYTVVTLRSHCRYTVVALLLDCWYTVVTLLVHCWYTVVTLLLHCCYTAVTLYEHCNHSQTAIGMLQQFKIGDLADAKVTPLYRPEI
jgi:hypothetical protein